MTELVVIVKVAVLVPAGTVTEAGTLADVLLLESETETPPVAAAALKFTVPVTDVPPVMLVGLTATDKSTAVAAGVTVSAAVLLTLL